MQYYQNQSQQASLKTPSSQRPEVQSIIEKYSQSGKEDFHNVDKNSIEFQQKLQKIKQKYSNPPSNDDLNDQQTEQKKNILRDIDNVHIQEYQRTQRSTTKKQEEQDFSPLKESLHTNRLDYVEKQYAGGDKEQIEDEDRQNIENDIQEIDRMLDVRYTQTQSKENQYLNQNQNSETSKKDKKYRPIFARKTNYSNTHHNDSQQSRDQQQQQQQQFNSRLNTTNNDVSLSVCMEYRNQNGPFSPEFKDYMDKNTGKNQYYKNPFFRMSADQNIGKGFQKFLFKKEKGKEENNENQQNIQEEEKNINQDVQRRNKFQQIPELNKENLQSQTQRQDQKYLSPSIKKYNLSLTQRPRNLVYSTEKTLLQQKSLSLLQTKQQEQQIFPFQSEQKYELKQDPIEEPFQQSKQQEQEQEQEIEQEKQLKLAQQYQLEQQKFDYQTQNTQESDRSLQDEHVKRNQFKKKQQSQQDLNLELEFQKQKIYEEVWQNFENKFQDLDNKFSSELKSVLDAMEAQQQELDLYKKKVQIYENQSPIISEKQKQTRVSSEQYYPSENSENIKKITNIGSFQYPSNQRNFSYQTQESSQQQYQQNNINIMNDFTPQQYSQQSFQQQQSWQQQQQQQSQQQQQNYQNEEIIKRTSVLSPQQSPKFQHMTSVDFENQYKPQQSLLSQNNNSNYNNQITNTNINTNFNTNTNNNNYNSEGKIQDSWQQYSQKYQTGDMVDCDDVNRQSISFNRNLQSKQSSVTYDYSSEKKMFRMKTEGSDTGYYQQQNPSIQIQQQYVPRSLFQQQNTVGTSPDVPLKTTVATGVPQYSPDARNPLYTVY